MVATYIARIFFSSSLDEETDAGGNSEFDAAEVAGLTIAMVAGFVILMVSAGAIAGYAVVLRMMRVNSVTKIPPTVMNTRHGLIKEDQC